MPDVVDQGDGQRYGGCPQQLVEVDVEVVRVEVELRVVHVLQLGDDEEVGGEADDDKEVGGDVGDGLLLQAGQRGRLVDAGRRRKDPGRLLVEDDSQRHDDVQGQADHLDESPAFRDCLRVRGGVQTYIHL